MKKFWLLAFICVVLVSCDSSSASSVDEESSETPSDSLATNPSTGDSLDVPYHPVLDTTAVDSSLVSNVKDLPSCTNANEGEAFYVDKENALYFCAGGNWNSDVSKLGGVSCSEGNLKFGNAPVASLPVRDAWKQGASIVGLAQKGPFRYGASVKIVELDSNKRMADSERSLETCIVSKDGSYSFSNIDLTTPYVRMEASGFYRNELTGGISSSKVSLKAISDFTNRDSVNVNMLTHLEAPRVLKLLENSGFNQPIRNMKSQALKEVLSAFEINVGGSSGGNGGSQNGGWNQGWFYNNGGAWGGQNKKDDNNTQSAKKDTCAEDIDMFGEGVYSEALLAVSVMMQCSAASGEDMISFADRIADEIKGNGSWNDNSSKAKLADCLVSLENDGGYETIRKNVESWKLGKVPEFEKHLRNFWAKTFQFESCGMQTYGQVKSVNNSMSSFFAPYYENIEKSKVRFVCDKSMSAWRIASDIEKDTIGFGNGEYDGQMRGGKINIDKFYVYEQRKRSWREATSEEIVTFEDISTVYEGLASDETVVFILRHAERTDDTGKNGHLTDNGKKQSERVGEKLKGADIYFANSSYTRTFETCEGIAKGAGIKDAPQDTLDFLLGEWFVKNDDKLRSYKDANGGGWVVFSKFAYTGEYSDAMYDLEDRSKELVYDKVIPMLPSMKRVNVLISHDQMVVPLVVYFTNKRINLRYYENQLWLNYLAGLAIIVNGAGDVRFVPVRGIDSGTMKQ